MISARQRLVAVVRRRNGGVVRNHWHAISIPKKAFMEADELQQQQKRRPTIQRNQQQPAVNHRQHTTPRRQWDGGKRQGELPYRKDNLARNSNNNTNNNNDTEPPAIVRSIVIDQRLKEYGSDWRAALTLFAEQQDDFNGRNWATLFNQFKQLQSFQVYELLQDQRFMLVLTFLQDAWEKENELTRFFGTQAVGNILHALAKLKIQNMALLEIVNEHAEWLVQEGTCQTIANAIWAYAVLGLYQPTNMLQQIQRHARRILDSDQNPQHVSNIVWSFAKLQYPAPQLFAALDRHALRMVEQGRPQAISNAAWSAATVKCPAPNLFGLVNQHAETLLVDWNVQDMSNIVWSAAALGYHVPNILAMVDARSEWIVHNGRPQEIASLLVGFAEVGYQPKQFLKQFAQRVNRFVSQAAVNDERGQWQLIINSLRSLVLLDMAEETEPLLQTLWDYVVESDSSVHMNVKHQYQLAHVRLYAEANGIALRKAGPELEKVLTGPVSFQDKAPIRGSLEEEYSRLLTDIGFVHERAVSPMEGNLSQLLSIDFACVKRKIGVELDGRPHYLVEPSVDAKRSLARRIETGRTKAKRNLLTKLGWKIVNISYLDDIEISKKGPDSTELKRKHLKEKLREVGIDVDY